MPQDQIHYSIKAPVMSDLATQTKLVIKEISIQAVDCSDCPNTPLDEKVRSYTRCARVDDLLCEVSELQETGERMHNIGKAEVEIGGFISTFLLRTSLQMRNLGHL